MKQRSKFKTKITKAKAKPGDKRLNNQFWKQRSKHGRDTIFETPEILWEESCNYFQWCDENPITKQELLKGGENAGLTKDIEIKRPYLLQELCLFLGVHTEYFNHFEYNLQGREDEKSKDFIQICKRIREIVTSQKLSGAMAGIYNPLITSRIEGLKDRQEVTQQSEIKVSVSDSEARKIAKSIKDSI